VPLNVGSLKISFRTEYEPFIELVVVPDLAAADESVWIRMQRSRLQRDERGCVRKRLEIRVGMPSEIAADLLPTKRMYIVLLAHDYKYELPVLREVLRSDAAYIGMLGSGRRGESIRSVLKDEGFTSTELSRLRTPVGLAIGAKSAAEIALAIAAEIVSMREGRSMADGLAPNVVTAVSTQRANQREIVAG